MLFKTWRIKALGPGYTSKAGKGRRGAFGEPTAQARRHSPMVPGIVRHSRRRGNGVSSPGVFHCGGGSVEPLHKNRNTRRSWPHLWAKIRRQSTRQPQPAILEEAETIFRKYVRQVDKRQTPDEKAADMADRMRPASM